MTMGFTNKAGNSPDGARPRFVPGFTKDVLHFRTSLDLSRAVDDVHTHDFIQMWYVLKGTYSHFFNGHEFLLGKGSLLVVPPFCAHSIDTRSDCELVRCEFSEDFINSFPEGDARNSLFNLAYLEPILVGANLLKPYHYFTGEAADKLESIFSELEQEYLKRDMFSSLFIRTNILRLLTVIARQCQYTSTQERDELFEKYRAAIQDALDYIDTHYMEKLYLKDVSKIALMSPQSFSYIFKQITGNTFTKYLMYLRVLHARELLAHTDRTQYDISRECGFTDTPYFHRIFKKFTGVLPGQYRSLHQKKEPEHLLKISVS